MHRYFAYGSNLHPCRLGARVTITADLGPAMVRGWRLEFHKRSIDGSGKGDIVFTGKSADVVHGSVYLLDDEARAVLDEIEGLGCGYRRHVLRVPGLGHAYCYVAEPSSIDPALAPYDWYLGLVRAGARYRRFPADYLARLDAIGTVPDPDAGRAALARRIVTA